MLRLAAALRVENIEIESVFLEDAGALADRDIRRGMPRFSPAHYPTNLALLPAYRELAREAGCTPAQLALAWLLAWPLSQALLVTDPGSLSRYAGLSATLHAGAAIVCWQLLWHARGARRAVGAAVAAAIALKLFLEVPVLQALWSATPAADQALAPLPDAPGHVLAGHAHGCGVWAGVMAAALVDGIMAWSTRRHRPT